MYVTKAHFPIPPDVVNTRRSHVLFHVHVGHKTSAFGVREGGMPMVTAFFDNYIVSLFAGMIHMVSGRLHSLHPP